MLNNENNESFHIQMVRGLPVPGAWEFKKENIESAMDHVPDDGDIIIASFPKTGTTWLQYIVLQIISKGEIFPTFDDLNSKIVPFIEMTGVDILKKNTKPRMWKHHLPYNMVRKNHKSKCLYIYRNPEDVAVSLYKFLQSYDEDDPLDFDIYFEAFMNGSVGFGSYFEHVLSFYKHRNDSNLLMISYEKLFSNTKEEILRIAKFMGDEYYQELIEIEELLQKIINNTSFQNMKRNLYMSHPDCQKANSDKKKSLNFFRKGVVGDGKNVLSDSQRKRIIETVQNRFKNTDIAQAWLNII